MSYDVSVIIPAYRAEPFLAKAVASVVAQAGVRAEIVIAADDAADYRSRLAAQGLDTRDVVQCRTPRVRSGPATARNLAAAEARADLLACLDADDAFAEGRLGRLMALADRHGAATGPTVEFGCDGATTRIAEPSNDADRLSARDIATVRMPYFPVFRREFLGAGWPDIVFAEDMVFNLCLAQAVDRYAFAPEARYHHHRRPGSLTDAPDTLERARTAYHQILAFLEEASWSDEVRAMALEVIREDLAAVDKVLGGSPETPASWRDALADTEGPDA